MSSRFLSDQRAIQEYLPIGTQHVQADGRDVWVFRKTTELGVSFEIALYYDKYLRGYCAQLVSPEIEGRWMNPHIGHIFSDGCICFGGDDPERYKVQKTIREAFAKSCLWAEGMAIMLASRDLGCPSEFPFSINNGDDEAIF